MGYQGHLNVVARVVVAAALAAALLVGCGSDDGDEAVSAAGSTSSTVAAQPPTTDEAEDESSAAPPSTDIEPVEGESANSADLDLWSWVRHEGAEVGLPEDGQAIEVTSLTFGEGLFVMSGYRQRAGEADGFVESPVIWTSPDASSWSAVDMAAAEPGEGLYAAAYGSRGFVAVGEVGGDAIGGPPVGAGIVWTSADGLSWTRHTPGEWAAFVPRAVAPTNDGAYVAVGATGRFRASVWSSSDGTTWDEVAVFEDSGGITLEDVVAGPGGFVAVGRRGEGEGTQAVVAHSADGLSWVDVADDEVFPAPSSPLNVEVDSDGGFVATGSDLESESRAALWTSPDGVRWERWPFQATDSFAYVGDIATVPNGGVTLVSGALADADQPWVESGALWWIATVEGSPTPELLPVGSVSLGKGVWSVTISEERLMALGRDGEDPSVLSDLVVWTATSE